MKLSQTTTKQKDLHVKGLIPNAAVLKARTYVEGTHRACGGVQVCEGLRPFSIALHHLFSARVSYRTCTSPIYLE